MKLYEISGVVNYHKLFVSAEFSAVVSQEFIEKANGLLEKKFKEEDKSIRSLTIDKINEINPNKEGVLSYSICPYR